MDEFQKMRSFIMATEPLGEDEPEMLTETTAAHPDSRLRQELEHVVFKLRAFMESSGGEFALGMELGMQRAADMIENALKHQGG